MQTRVPHYFKALTALVLSASVAACSVPVTGAEGAPTDNARAPTDSENRDLLAEVNNDKPEDLELHAVPAILLVAGVVALVGGGVAVGAVVYNEVDKAHHVKQMRGELNALHEQRMSLEKQLADALAKNDQEAVDALQVRLDAAKKALEAKRKQLGANKVALLQIAEESVLDVATY